MTNLWEIYKSASNVDNTKDFPKIYQMASLYRFPQPTNNSEMRDMMILKDTYIRKKK